MLLVLATIAMATILGLSFLRVTTVKLAGSANLLRASRSRYLAESGMQHAFHLLRTSGPELEGATAGSPLGPFHVDGTEDTYVLYTSQTSPGEYVVTAKGTCGRLTRTSSARVRVTNSYAADVKGHNPLYYWRLGDEAGPVAHDERDQGDGTYFNGVELGRRGALGEDPDRAAHFDGFNDYINLGQVLEVKGSTLTFLLWFKADDFNVPDARLLSKADGTLPGNHLWMLGTAPVGGNMRVQFLLKPMDNVPRTLLAGSGNLKVGEWTMVAATYDGFWMRLYGNAEMVGSRAIMGEVDSLDKGTAIDAWIGNNPNDDTSRPFHGVIDEVAIFKKRLTSTEIRALYDARIASVDVLSWDE